MKLLLRWLINALLLMVIAYVVPGVVVSSLPTALVVAALLGLINALIRPIILLVTLPINIVTLGLFTLVINALLIWSVASFVGGFILAGFWSAFWTGMLMSFGSWLVSRFIKQSTDNS